MGKLVVTNSVTLDGVMQAPGRPDEDRRDGFTRGGWAVPFNDAVMASAMGEGMANAGPMLFGRRTYEDFASVWPNMPDDNPYAAVLNRVTKFVASTTLQQPLPWRNSVLLKGDVLDAVAALKAEEAKDIVILGSGELVQSLMPARLIDRFVLLIHPLVFGSGRRLFPDGGVPASLRLADSKVTTTGVIIATYEVA